LLFNFKRLIQEDENISKADMPKTRSKALIIIFIANDVEFGNNQSETQDRIIIYPDSNEREGNNKLKP
jgi:hypothetical protein